MSIGLINRRLVVTYLRKRHNGTDLEITKLINLGQLGLVAQLATMLLRSRRRSCTESIVARVSAIRVAVTRVAIRVVTTRRGVDSAIDGSGLSLHISRKFQAWQVHKDKSKLKQTMDDCGEEDNRVASREDDVQQEDDDRVKNFQ